MKWATIGKLTEREARLVAQQESGLAELLLERLGQACNAWNSLPLVLRVEIGGSKSAQRHFPSRVLDLAPPAPDINTVGGNGSFLVLDLETQCLRLVLYDWDCLALDRNSLDLLGVSPTALHALLQRNRRRLGEESDKRYRWNLELSDESIKIETGALDSDVAPVVGRFSLGELIIEGLSYGVEVLALPRLSAPSFTDGETIALGYSDKCLRFLRHTIWARGNPKELLGMLRLAHSPLLNFDLEAIRMSSAQDPSPLALLALLHALEAAADHQRRQYTRRSEVLSTPSGTIRIGAWINNIARQRPDRVPVERFTLTPDCVENRLLRGMASLFGRRLNHTGELGAWLARRFEVVEEAFHQAQLVEPAMWMCEIVLQKGGLPEPIMVAVEQCRLVLSGRYPSLDLTPTDLIRVQSFEVDLAQLFEAAMRGLVQQLFRDSHISTIDGNEEAIPHRVRWKKQGGGANIMKPDIVLLNGKEVFALGDAKYKKPFRDSSYKPLSRPDFQQIMTYMLTWPEAQYGLILMPASEDIPEGRSSFLLQELSLPDGRVIAVFQISAARWQIQKSSHEPLVKWLHAGRFSPSSPEFST